MPTIGHGVSPLPGCLNQYFFTNIIIQQDIEVIVMEKVLPNLQELKPGKNLQSADSPR
jgi:hypothetical protein